MSVLLSKCGSSCKVHNLSVSASKRKFSSTPIVITNSFIDRYDNFATLSTVEKVQCLTTRTLDVLLHQRGWGESNQITNEAKWDLLRNRLAKEGKKLPLFDRGALSVNLKRVVQMIEIPVLQGKNTPLSVTAKHWQSDEELFTPLSAGPTMDQRVICRILPRYLKRQSALIGAGSWNGVETFHFLRALAFDETARSCISYVSNIEINPLNAKLAHITALELGLSRHRVVSNIGNPLEVLPPIPRIFDINHQAIIACRLLPCLTLLEISKILNVMKDNLMQPTGYAILTYPVISLSDWRNPHTIFLQKYMSLVQGGVFEIKKLIEDNKEYHIDDNEKWVGVSFISNIDDPTQGLIQGSIYQTFLFQERVNQLFSRRKMEVLEKENTGFDPHDKLQREIAILTPIG